MTHEPRKKDKNCVFDDWSDHDECWNGYELFGRMVFALALWLAFVVVASFIFYPIYNHF